MPSFHSTAPQRTNVASPARSAFRRDGRHLGDMPQQGSRTAMRVSRYHSRARLGTRPATARRLQMGDLLDESLHEDRRLVRRLRDGDESAFQEFWTAHADRLYRFALSRTGGNTDQARDTVQAALCKALENLDSYRGTGSLFSWICGICRFEVSARQRRDRRRGPHLSLDVDSGVDSLLNALLATTDDPEAELLRGEARRRVHDTLDRLPRRHAQALEWKYAASLSVREIASRLELSEKAAESLLTRARNAFRDAFAAARDESARDGEPGDER